MRIYEVIQEANKFTQARADAIAKGKALAGDYRSNNLADLGDLIKQKQKADAKTQSWRDMKQTDDDDLRRGKPTTHKKYDEATAILAGDALHSLAYEIVANDAHLSIEQKVNIIKLLSDACGFNGMILGQQLDLESEGSDSGDINKIHALKTGRLISASLALPITNSKLRMKLMSVGEDIGLAFQIMDDVLEVTASSGTLGKDSESDVKNKKLTYVSVYGLEPAIKNAEKLIEQSKNKIIDLDGNLNSKSLLEICDFIISRDN